MGLERELVVSELWLLMILLYCLRGRGLLLVFLTVGRVFTLLKFSRETQIIFCLQSDYGLLDALSNVINNSISIRVLLRVKMSFLP